MEAINTSSFDTQKIPSGRIHDFFLIFACFCCSR
jgi:hypothetical protein